MSSFDLNDEVLFKAKYLKYKNKYLSLKEQLGGLPFDKTTSILFYQSSSLPELDDLKKRYVEASNSDKGTVDVDGKSMPIEKYLLKEFNLPLEAVNGLPNIFEYKAYGDKILPSMIFNFEAQEKLLKCTESSGFSLMKLGFGKSALADNQKDLLKAIDNFKSKTRILLKDEIGNVNPLTETNLKSKIPILMNLINSNSNNQSKAERDTAFAYIVNKFLNSFTKTFNQSLEAKKMRQGYVATDEGEKVTVKISDVDSYIVVKGLKFDNKKGITFTIVNPGSEGAAAGSGTSADNGNSEESQ